MRAAADVRAVGVAAGSAVVVSAAWYAAFGDQLARFDAVYAEGSPPPAWVLPVELMRSTAVATAVAVLAESTHAEGPVGAVKLALGLWGAFPVVLLTGSVVHEKVPWQQAAIHGGDWLLKLVLIAAVVGRERRGCSSQSPSRGRQSLAGFGDRRRALTWGSPTT